MDAAFPVTTIGSYLENKVLMPLFPIRKNYTKIITHNDSGSATATDVKEGAWLQSHAAVYVHFDKALTMQ